MRELNLNEKLACFTVCDLKQEAAEFLNRKVTNEELLKIYDRFFELHFDIFLEEFFIALCEKVALDVIR